MKLALRTVSLAVLVSFGATACSTSYMPAAGPRASIVMEGGKPAIARDGHVYSIGAFGGGLEEAVAGNPRAEEHARTYNADLTVGFACTMLSLAAMIGGGTLVGVDAANDRSASNPGIGLLAAAAALYVTGLTFLASAPPHFYDALNIYNDGVDQRGPDAKLTLPGPAATHHGWSFSPTAGARER